MAAIESRPQCVKCIWCWHLQSNVTVTAANFELGQQNEFKLNYIFYQTDKAQEFGLKIVVYSPYNRQEAYLFSSEQTANTFLYHFPMIYPQALIENGN